MLNHLEAEVTKHDSWGTTKTIMQEIIQDLTVFGHSSAKRDKYITNKKLRKVVNYFCLGMWWNMGLLITTEYIKCKFSGSR